MPKIILILAAIAALIFFGYNQFFTETYITSDTLVKGNYSINQNKTVIAKNGAKLTVLGDMNVKGILGCENGPLNLEVKGKLTVDGVINCQRQDNEFKEKQAAVLGLSIVVSGSADFNKDSVVASNGSIQIVDDPNFLLKTPEDLAKAYDETGEDSGEGIRIGPLVDEQNPPQNVLGSSIQLIRTAQAQTPPFYVIGGAVIVGSFDKPLPKKLDLSKLSKYGDKVLVLFKLKKGNVVFPKKGFMKGPDGLDGKSVKGGCAIDLSKIKPGQPDAAGKGYRMRVDAKAIVVDDYDLYLGRGGRGGNAETDKDCKTGMAIAGNGGEAANMKWTADEYIEIKEKFTLHPGKAGDGGDAIAYGKDGQPGCPGDKGGDAAAKGGNGADNIKRLRAQGDVRGLSNIYIDSVTAGNGGKAEAHPGKGGDGSKCDCQGGTGGKGVENFGKGGSIELMKLPQGVNRTDNSQDRAGEDAGQDRIFVAGSGKDGPVCADKVVKPTPKQTPVLKIDGGSTSSDYSDGYFEFLDTATGQPSIAFSTAQKPHIIVSADPGKDVRTWLPIKIEIKKDGNNFWSGKIEGNPKQVCRGPSGCSINGPSGIGVDWKKIEITAYDKNNRLVAVFGETYDP